MMANGAKSIMIVGGGNIGSHTVAGVAALPGIARVTVMDRDVYSEKNLASQAIVRSDVGRPKPLVLAQQLRRRNPALEVVAICDALENVPLGRLRADVVLTCLDSRAARQVANEVVFRLGVPVWIDAGVQSSDLLARVTTFTPGAGGACLECQWTEDDYQAVRQSYACDGGLGGSAPTDGLACLGALAGALQAIDCHTVLGGTGTPPAPHEVVLDARWHQHYVTRLHRNPHCRFDHETWQIEPVPDGIRALGRLAALGAGEEASVRVAGRVFARDLVCRGCGRRRGLWLLSAWARPETRCRCGATTSVPGHALFESLSDDSRVPRWREHSLRGIGLRAGDVVSVTGSGGVRHFEVPRRRSRGGTPGGRAHE